MYKKLSPEEQICEFTQEIQTTTRDPDVRFVVKLPFNGGTGKLGNSYDKAEKRFFLLTRRFDKDSASQKQYRDFIKEFGHTAFGRNSLRRASKAGN